MSEYHPPAAQRLWPYLLILAVLSSCGRSENGERKTSQPQPMAAVATGASASGGQGAQAGLLVYQRFGCGMCHGEGGKGGVKNPNAQTAGEIPKLQYVAEGYTPAELKNKIREGVWEVARADSTGQRPPFRMPSYKGWMTEQEIDQLSAYLISLFPKGQGEKW